jgi:alkylation response protein AidB-like acyl-CoA dehydrogenase
MVTEIALEEFVKGVQEFFDNNSQRVEFVEATGWGKGSDSVASLGGDGEESDRYQLAQEWRAKLFDAGYGWITGPTEFGGAGLSTLFEDAFFAVADQYETPDQSVFQVSRGMVSPAILVHGSEEMKKEHLPRIHRGDTICCQLLSEPEAGSDLAGLKTKAVRDGDEWVVNGQKVWSSYAHIASVGQLLARTDSDAPKHAGLTMFLLPMDTPGIEVRPLRQMNGEAHFNEVFFTDVRVPDANRVGDAGGGWRAILTTLMNERHVVANKRQTGQTDVVGRLIELARQVGATGDRQVRDRLADVVIHDQVLKFLKLRMDAAVKAGGQPGPEGSIAKLIYTTQLRRIANLAGELLGPSMIADSGEWGTYAWSRFLCGNPGLRIAGGTDEIQRNTIAERSLGLPKEPR